MSFTENCKEISRVTKKDAYMGEKAIDIAVLQAGTDHSRNGNPGFEANFKLFKNLAEKAAANKPDLIVFPEYAIPGWPYPDEEEFHSIAEPVPGRGYWYGRYVELAVGLDTAVLGWMLEWDNGKLYNTALLIDRDGSFTGKYRKVHANLGEQIWYGFSQGEAFSLIEFRGLKLGVSICSDMWYPETVLCESLLGADVIIHMSIADDMQDITPVRAKDSEIPIILSSFNGGSYMVDPLGKLIDKASHSDAEYKLFHLTSHKPRTDGKYGGLWIPKEGHKNVRNPSAYGIVTDRSTRPAWTEVFFDDNGGRQSEGQIRQRYFNRYDADDPVLYHIPPVKFEPPWTSPYTADPQYPYHLVNREGQHLFILNKTAWAYFKCSDPEGFLRRAAAQGINVLRVALEGRPYYETLGYDLWPWLGSRENPDWSGFDEAYWDQVEERISLAGKLGIGFDLVIYMTLKPAEDDIVNQRKYWMQILRRLSKYANILTWEIANEYIRNEAFQDAAGAFFKGKDPYGRPVCTSDGTNDDAVWPAKPWVGLAINHTCTSSTEQHPLDNWYKALANNTRGYGKPAFCNESGREIRHGNDDPVHRRKQGWIWCASGCYWTLHSWEGCEGINDPHYKAPGQEFFKPMAEFFQSIPFWRLSPNFTTIMTEQHNIILTVLSEADQNLVAGYVCTPDTGKPVHSVIIKLRLPDGQYRISFLNPSDNTVMEQRAFESEGRGIQTDVPLPDFTDDLLMRIDLVEKKERTLIKGTL